MPSFETPEPISVTVELGVGDLRVVAGDRADTVVEVLPSNPAKKADVAAAAETRVEYANGMLLIKAPSRWLQYSFRGGNESVDVRIDLPAGSHLDAKVGAGPIRSTGRLGNCRAKTGVGEIRLDETGALEATTGAGEIRIGAATGRADVTTGTGALRIGSVSGAAAVKNSNGDTWIGDVGGDLRVVSANGSIAVDRAEAPWSPRRRTARYGWAKSSAAPSSPRPPPARSTSASSMVSPRGSTSTRASAM